MASKYIERERMIEKMKHMMSYPLSIVHAPIGYGKTVAVKQFISVENISAVWVSLISSEGSVDFLWKKLCEVLSNKNKSLGDQLGELGFPYDCFKTQAVLDVLMDFDYIEPLVIVLDDFQVINDERVFLLIKTMVLSKITGLHFIIITRELSKLDAADLYQKQLCLTVTEKSLKFTREEVGRYIKITGCELSLEEEEEIYQSTDGWVSMIYIIMKGVNRGLAVHKSATIDDIIEQNLYGSLDKMSKEILMKLSLFNTFTKSMMAYVLDDNKYYEPLEILIHKNLFLVFNEYDNNYKIRNLLQKFLKEKAVLSGLDFNQIYKRGGLWYLQEKQYENAFEYLLKAGECKLILEQLNYETPYDIQQLQFPLVQRIFQKDPGDYCYEYPIAYLQYIRISIMSGEPGVLSKCKYQLQEMEDYYQDMQGNEEYFRSILGEIYTIKTMARFNNLKQMVKYSKKATNCFQGGCSSIVTRKKEFTFGSPHLLFCYYRKIGTYKETMEAFVEAAPSLMEPVNRCGTGSDSLVIAEYALETGDFDRAELYAYKAFYKGKTVDQLGIMISAKFCLDRINVMKGSVEEQYSLMTSLREEVIKENNPILNTTYDLCNAYVNACMGRFDQIQDWIKKGSMNCGNFLYQGQGYYYIIYGRMLLHSKDYIQLDALCESVDTYFEPYHTTLGYLYFKIYESITKGYLESREVGVKILKEALDDAKEDQLIMPFAEHSTYIYIMLQDLVAKNVDAYYQKILTYCKEYLNQLKQLDVHVISLTKREIEILKLLDRGYTHDEIGKTLFISITTVRYHIQNIYQKMEVNNKILALRRAKDLNLI